jgi:hypothetical protein
MTRQRRFRMISCEVSQREVCAAVARSRNLVDVDFLTKGLHDVGQARMAERLQQAVNARPPAAYEAVLFWYGLCNNGLCGVRAPVPMVVPRAHDCITLLLGSRVRFAEYFDANPGTFFKSPGWIERDSDPNDNPASITARLRMSRGFIELAEKYGEENARYLLPAMADWFKHYRKLAFIDTGVGDVEEYRRRARDFAAEKSWEYEELKGDAGLLDRMLAGDWNADEFLVLEPGKTLRPTFRPDIMEGA